MKLIALLAMFCAVVGLTACGGKSKSDKAKENVCNASSDISKQVDTLKGLTLSTATLDQVQTSLKAIDKDLTTIRDNAGDLKGSIKGEIEQANQTFTNKVKNIVSTLGQSTSLDQAKSQATGALQQLGSAYQATFAKVSCG